MPTTTSVVRVLVYQQLTPPSNTLNWRQLGTPKIHLAAVRLHLFKITGPNRVIPLQNPLKSSTPALLLSPCIKRHHRSHYQSTVTPEIRKKEDSSVFSPVSNMAVYSWFLRLCLSIALPSATIFLMAMQVASLIHKKIISIASGTMF